MPLPEPDPRLPVTGSARPADFATTPPIASETAAEPSRPVLSVPSEETERIISGIDLIDYGVGGLYPDHVYIVKGGVGTGKSILGLQFLIRGLELGEPGILVTDQRPEKVIAQARSLDLPIEEAVKRGQLLILNTSQRYFELVESPADVMAIMEELEEYVRERATRRLVIDPIYSLINTTYSGHFALAIGQSLMNALEELPVTTLLVSGDDQTPELASIERMLEQNAFGTVTLQADQATGGRIMRLSRLRYANADHMAAHYRILNGRGLINYQGEGETVADVTKPWDEPEIRRSVLLVGATPETIRKVEESLGETYKVSAETDMERALERVKSEKPGLVLVTPSRALQSMSAVAELSRNSSSSVAFLSPSANRASDRVLYLRAGADDFITQPFSASELRARVEALVRRSGRRLTVRDSGIGTLDPEELQHLDRETRNASTRKTAVFTRRDGRRAFENKFEDRLRRNIDTVSKFDTNFALYWLKADAADREVNRTLARLCRQEDVLCHNGAGEFVAILTGTDENGVRGFESRLSEKLGKPLESFEHGYALHQPGQSTDDLPSRALSA
ncbi:MAG TPA: ATPase domain-containing protein [Thermoanaerobaculia bacterium]|nr:ATPase domain-containing protein [Thermoanaerobaculia bacterium]